MWVILIERGEATKIMLLLSYYDWEEVGQQELGYK